MGQDASDGSGAASRCQYIVLSFNHHPHNPAPSQRPFDRQIPCHVPFALIFLSQSEPSKYLATSNPHSPAPSQRPSNRQIPCHVPFALIFLSQSEPSHYRARSPLTALYPHSASWTTNFPATDLTSHSRWSFLLRVE